jgi:hypothetical protein
MVCEQRVRGVQRVIVHLALVSREPPEGALLALAQRDPILDAGRLERVQQVLALKGKVALEDEHTFCMTENADAPQR